MNAFFGQGKFSLASYLGTEQTVLDFLERCGVRNVDSAAFNG
jgi:hypothetical protein